MTYQASPADYLPGEATTRQIESDQAEQLPTSDRRYRRLGMLILLVAFGGFGGWAMTANLAIAVVAPGAVSVESFKKTLQHYEGGIVERILVQDGDKVEAGAPLLVLDDTQSRAQLQIAQSEYHIARASEIRLLAEQAGEEALVFPDDLLESPSPRVQAVLSVQRKLFAARRESLHGALASLDEQALQMQEQIVGLEATQRINRSRIASLAEEANAHRSLFKSGLGNSQRLRELEREIMEYQAENARYNADAARLRSQISENLLQKAVRNQEFLQEVGEQLRTAQAQIADSEERITALDDQVQRTQIIAPVSGTVVGMQIHTLGAVIRSGDPLMDIVPSGDGFVVEARVPDRDIDNIYLGQPAEIRFSAFNQRMSNVIDGEVTHVSADSFEDEATRTRYYKTRIHVTDAGQESMTETMQLLAGMPAEVMIKTGERTFASYVAKPFTDLIARAMREE
ncbi:HlyD family type I secretion periplasmic adaptor subunit [Litchfieldella xinjiangensis]|uniref:HlyD family type I secretion periplasmic adaptor subunit n=1 Tax=Litchfieldella xinjiangensis TaxID=1166948 RepID=UPI0005B806B8|nr:HlyD family type I secretion periplasmic adaptor subunit [Halomonas xinjiangensis]